MAIIAPILAFLGKQLGRIVTTALGWASILLFGRVPQSRQLILALMTLGSLAWVAMLLGVIVPDVGTLLLGFVPVPDFINPDWVRLAMLAGAIITPLVIGLGGYLIPDAPERPKGMRGLQLILRGYPLALLLAFTLVFLAVVGVALKARSIMRRWADAHVPVVVEPGGYESLVADLEAAIDQAGLDVTRRAAPAVLSAPARLVGLVAGGGIRALVPDGLTMLVARDLEVSLYPSDIAISGKPAPLARARAAIASRLAASTAYLTTTKESQVIEDRLTALAQRPPSRNTFDQPVLDPSVVDELAAIDAILTTIQVDYDEWEVLYRLRLQVERDLRVGARVGEAFPGAADAADAPAPAAPMPRPSAVLAAAGLALVVLDVGLAIFERFRPPARR